MLLRLTQVHEFREAIDRLMMRKVEWLLCVRFSLKALRIGIMIGSMEGEWIHGNGCVGSAVEQVMGPSPRRHVVHWDGGKFDIPARSGHPLARTRYGLPVRRPRFAPASEAGQPALLADHPLPGDIA